MQFTWRFKLAAGVCALGISSTALALPINLGDAANYNGFFFNDFSSTPNDSQGALAIGGDANLQGYTVSTLGNATDTALVVGGNLTQTGGDINGNAYVAGNYNASGGAGINGSMTSNTGLRFLPVDFASTHNQLNQLSQSLMGLGSPADAQWGRVDYNGDGSIDQQIFNLDEDSFETAWGFFANNIQSDQEIIVNVAGTIIDIDSADYLIKAANYLPLNNNAHLLYNFYEAEEITLSGGFHGTILAVNADIIGNGGSVDGQVIANSWQGATQLNAPLFQGTSVPVPEPSTLGLLPIGFLGLFALRRKQKN